MRANPRIHIARLQPTQKNELPPLFIFSWTRRLHRMRTFCACSETICRMGPTVEVCLVSEQVAQRLGTLVYSASFISLPGIEQQQKNFKSDSTFIWRTNLCLCDSLVRTSRNSGKWNQTMTGKCYFYQWFKRKRFLLCCRSNASFKNLRSIFPKMMNVIKNFQLRTGKLPLHYS